MPSASAAARPAARIRGRAAKGDLGALIETNHSAKQLMQDQGITHDYVFAVEGMGRALRMLADQQELPDTLEVENGGRGTGTRQLHDGSEAHLLALRPTGQTR